MFRRSSSTRKTNTFLQVPLTSPPAVDLSLNEQLQQQGGGGAPILQFPPSLPLGQVRDPSAIKNASDGRGAAWLKLFLFVYAVPTLGIHRCFLVVFLGPFLAFVFCLFFGV